ncbi:alpha/beta fold hydrolase [Plastoroseomonas arctica]|uniref:Alpha/beta hydrolase n=1 Tax=Plastoroseomonas arctica TaxID=1509237 RepID=A0AAF1JY72_9PROT|nr:alpha/beta hydrolase [Plastoroseomonas arctica]MBR0656704.1 alpha/beta hydrolase [Plastoroseomonas arctica]
MTPHRISARDGLILHAEDWRPPAGAAHRSPVLCLPGVCRTGADFRRLAERQSRTRRVVTLDYAGRGASDRAADPARYRPDIAIRDVLDVMAALQIDRPVVVGTSFGGLIAMAIGVIRPTALGGVVLNDIGPEIGAIGHAFVLDFLRRDPNAESLEACEALLRAALPPQPELDAAGWREFADLTFAKGEDGRFHPRWDTRLIDEAVGAGAGPRPDLWGFFGALAHVPLMLVWGEVSEILLPATVARMRKQRPDMSVVALPGTGHAPTLTEAAAIAGIDAFIAAIP